MLAICLSYTAKAQIGINTDGSCLDDPATLYVKSSDKRGTSPINVCVSHII